MRQIRGGNIVRVWVYDCTGADGVDDQKTNERWYEVAPNHSVLEYYEMRIAIGASTYDKTHHWTGCALCPTLGVKQAHTFNKNNICTVCGYYKDLTINPGLRNDPVISFYSET